MDPFGPVSVVGGRKGKPYLEGPIALVTHLRASPAVTSPTPLFLWVNLIHYAIAMIVVCLCANLDFVYFTWGLGREGKHEQVEVEYLFEWNRFFAETCVL